MELLEIELATEDIANILKGNDNLADIKSPENSKYRKGGRDRGLTQQNGPKAEITPAGLTALEEATIRLLKSKQNLSTTLTTEDKQVGTHLVNLFKTGSCPKTQLENTNIYTYLLGKQMVTINGNTITLTEAGEYRLKQAIQEYILRNIDG